MTPQTSFLSRVCVCMCGQGAENAQVHAASIDRTGLQLTIDDVGLQEIKFKL